RPPSPATRDGRRGGSSARRAEGRLPVRGAGTDRRTGSAGRGTGPPAGHTRNRDGRDRRPPHRAAGGGPGDTRRRRRTARTTGPGTFRVAARVAYPSVFQIRAGLRGT